MSVSLVVCTRNRAERLAECLRRINQLEYARPWELILVDNGSTDDTLATIERFQAGCPGEVRVLVEPVPGLARARNRGWRAARYEIVAFIDDDCYADRHFLHQVVTCMEEDDRLGFLGGRVLLHDPSDHPITINKSEERVELPPASVIYPGRIHGANCSFRRAALAAVGGFDELLGPGGLFNCEDCDMQARLSDAGWYGAYDPRPVVEHHHGRNAEQARRLQKDYDRGIGGYYARRLLTPARGRVYATEWYWIMRMQPLGRSLREGVAAVEYFARWLLNVGGIRR